MRARVPKSILFGVPLSVGFALFMLATGAELWMAGVGLGIGLLVVPLIAMFTDGSDPVAVTTVHWRGGDRRAIVVRYSRWKFGCGSFVVIASVAGFGFVAVMASRDIGVAALAAAVGLTVSVPLIALVVGPNEVVLLRDGLLIRRGLLRDYVPWASIADIGVVRTYGEYATEFLRVTPRTPDAIESNRPGQLWRRVLRRRDIPLSLSFLRAPAEDLVHTVMRMWRDPRSIELSDPSVAPTAPSDVRAGIEQVVNGSATFAIFHTDYARNRYVQIVGGDDGGLIAEAVSNAYLPPGEDLGDAAIESLRRLGWEGPDAESGNYRIRLVAASADEIGSVAGFLLRTLREVYGLGPDDLPRVELG